MHFLLFLISLFQLSYLIGLAFAAPQGYNYQIQGVSNAADNNEYTPEQYQILQQFYQQQQEQEQLEQQQLQQHLQAQYQQQMQSQQQHQQQITTVENPSDLRQRPQPTEYVVTPTQLVHETQQQPLEITAAVKEQGYQTTNPAVQIQNQVFQQPSMIEIVQPESYTQSHVEQRPQSAQYSKPAAFIHSEHLNSKPQDYKSIKYNKEFYFLAAPKEDNDDVPRDLQDQLNQMKRNIRVVFIKAPEQNGLANAALQLAKQSSESQTAIYVLTKQQDVADLANKLQEIRGSSSAKAKPEVIFIKYKTPEEAEHAQHTIQAQYEALDGPNNFNYQGVAPSHSFVGSADVDPRKSIGKIIAESAHVETAEVERPTSQYLPTAEAAKKKK